LIQVKYLGKLYVSTQCFVKSNGNLNLQHCNDVFSPLFLLTYVANVGYLFTRLYTGLQQDLQHPNFSVKLESVYAFGYQILIKILFPSYLAARLNERG
jgi:hypothetical protein